MINEGAVDFTNQDVQVRQNFSDSPAKIFRPETNKTYRIHFVDSQTVMRRRHFNPLTKKYYRCLEYTGYCPICKAAADKVGEGANRIKNASDTFGVNLLVYATDDAGTLVQPLSADVYFWAFGSDKFVQLRNIVTEWGSLQELDLTVSCTDGQFQKVTITPAKKCYYLEDPSFKAICDNKIKNDCYPVDKFLCREKTMQELVAEFKLDPMRYLPPDVVSQMPQSQQSVQSAMQEVSQQQVQQPVQQTQQTVQQSTPQVQQPAPQAPNFSDLDALASLL